MLCVQCQREIVNESVYCAVCGARQQGNRPQDNRRLRRSTSEKRIAGVCGGLAEYFNVDVSLVRLAWVVLTIVPGAIFFGVLAYLAAWVLMPESKEVPVARSASAKRARRRIERSGGSAAGSPSSSAWIPPRSACSGSFSPSSRVPSSAASSPTSSLGSSCRWYLYPKRSPATRPVRPRNGGVAAYGWGLGTGKGAAAARHHQKKPFAGGPWCLLTGGR